MMTKNIIESGIQAIILNEDRKNPMSDESIVSSLEKMDISVSRRTVAKYRDKLGIPPSSRRKIYA